MTGGRRIVVLALAVVAVGSLGGIWALRSGLDQRSSTHPEPSPTPPAPSIPFRTQPAGGGAMPPVAWVSPDGDDLGRGTSDDPWRTPQRAVDSGSKRVLLMAGNHPGFVVSRQGLEVARAGDERAVVVGQVVVVASGVRIRGLEITGVDAAYEAGLLIENATDVRVVDCLVHGNTFGIQLRSASATIDDNELTGNGAAIEIHGSVPGTVIQANRIHHNDRAVDRSRGANGVVFYRATGPVRVVDNEIWSNTNPEPAPGADPGGGAFEVYASTDVVIDGNRIWDSSVLETGTEDGLPCSGLTFIRNVAWRGTTAGRQEGLVLRCAEDGLVAHNTLDGFDRFAVDIAHGSGGFGGSVEGLRVINNIFALGRAYSIDTALPPSVVIDHNITWNPGSPAEHGEFLAYVAGRGNTSSQDEMRSWGLDPSSVSSDPLFVDRGTHDYRLAAGSPAIDAALVVPGLNDDTADGRPDAGPFERAGSHGG